MPVTELQGKYVGVYVRDYGSTDPYKRLVCEETCTIDASNDVTTTKTKCGVFKGIDVTDWKITGNAVANFNPGSAEISLDALQQKQVNRVKLDVVVQNEAFTEGGTSYTAGKVFKFAGPAYLTQCNVTAATNEVVKFTFNFEGEGTPDLTETP